MENHDLVKNTLDQIPQGFPVFLGVQKNTVGYNICGGGRFSKLLPRIVSIITTEPKVQNPLLRTLDFLHIIRPSADTNPKER